MVGESSILTNDGHNNHHSIIALSGLIGSGKNEVARQLVQYGFQEFSYADALKDIVSILFGYDREMLEGVSPEARELRNKIDPFWAEKLGIPNWTPRMALQHIGTNVMRNHFHKEIWVNCLLSKIRNIPKVVVVDCRFPNELHALTNIGAYSVRVVRGPNPEWWAIAEKFNRESINGSQEADSLRLDLEKFGVHPSEYSLAGYKFDMVIDNNKSLTDLAEQVKTLISALT